MQSDPDYQMAFMLQQQFNTEYNIENPSPSLTYNDKKKKNVDNKQSLIDPSWELVDPTPNIYELFVQFNNRFFWNKLLAVAVSWSKRMTSCAGICSYQGRGGLCHITLSEPLLKLRPRKDLIETLLHEMIHAFLFVTHNNKDRDGHGPEFHKHMYRINNEAGTHITVYHDFHDEVRLYKQHWWRCDGPCQKRPPFFGMVRRAMNRAPGPYDRWWAEHQQTCGGKFIKVKEPEKNTSKNKTNVNTKNTKLNSPKKNSPSKNKSVLNLPDIRNYLPVLNNNTTENPNIHTIKSIQAGSSGIKNRNGTIVINSKNNASTSSVDVSKNVKNNIEVFSGEGKKLIESSNANSSTNFDYSVVRNHWANKFTSSNNQQPLVKRKSLNFETDCSKKPKMEEMKTCPNCNDFILESKINSHLSTCLNADDSLKTEFSDDSFKMVECPICKSTMEEDSLNDHLDECLTNDLDKNKDNSQNDMKRCELCDNSVLPEDFTIHVQDCLNKCYDNIEKDLELKPTTSSELVLCLVCNKNILKDDLNNHLEDCMRSVFDKKNFKENDDENSNDSVESGKYNCPICMEAIDETNMNSHIDECLNLEILKNKNMFD